MGKHKWLKVTSDEQWQTDLIFEVESREKKIKATMIVHFFYIIANWTTRLFSAIKCLIFFTELT